jgi:glyoxylase-like metal-dependent hydrolase (beta-lactamase superfamily II)/8-oxo-dGTP pyrophosphatase MutT (NUDIX family)
MSELPDGIEPAPIPEPKDSALGIITRRDGDRFEVLLGLRSRGSRFMPGNLAFPGGKLEPVDQPGHPGALERCASREVLEETGIAIAPEAWLDAGERTTPPFFTVRFRTRFLVAELPDGATLPTAPPASEEIEALRFHRPGDVMAAWQEGRATVPPPLVTILRALVLKPPVSIAAMAATVHQVNTEEQATPRVEFVPGVWALPLRTRTLPPASCTNVWMPGGNRFVVIDPGSEDTAEIKALLAVVRKRQTSGSVPAAVVLTHHHRDHVGGAAAVARALAVPVWAHAETLSRTSLGDLPRRAIEDQEVLDLDGLSLRAIHTPGHAPGHLAFFEPRHGALIAGDLVSGLSTILVGFADGSMEDYLRSLRSLEALPVRTVLPAHGPPLPAKSISATRAHREAREAAVAAALAASPRELSEIAREAYADTPDAPALLTEMQTRAHLVRLAEKGRARAEDPDGRRWSTSPS